MRIPSHVDLPEPAWAAEAQGHDVAGRAELSLGKSDAAAAHFDRALKLLGAHLEPDHLSLTTLRSSLACVLEAQRRYEEAEPLFLRALAAYDRVLGGEHPDTLMSVNNLAGLYKSQGRYEEAEPLFLRALAVHERVLGAEHPHTLTSVNNLAIIYKTRGGMKKLSRCICWRWRRASGCWERSIRTR